MNYGKRKANFGFSFVTL